LTLNKQVINNFLLFFLWTLQIGIYGSVHYLYHSELIYKGHTIQKKQDVMFVIWTGILLGVNKGLYVVKASCIAEGYPIRIQKEREINRKLCFSNFNNSYRNIFATFASTEQKIDFDLDMYMSSYVANVNGSNFFIWIENTQSNHTRTHIWWN